MESSYSEEHLGGYYEGYYSPDQGGSYYDPDCSNVSYDAQDPYIEDDAKICAGIEEQTSSKWKEILEVIIIEIQENKKVTYQQLLNLERNISLLEKGLATLTVQVGELELHMGALATAVGCRHTPGTLLSLPEINPKGKCHALQLRSGTTYQPPEASDLGRGRKKKEKGPTNLGIPIIPYPQRLKSKKLDAQFNKFLEAISKVHINIPLVEALQQMPNYAKFLKDVVAKKRKWGKYKMVNLTENCSAILQKGLPTKHKDLGNFILSCVLGNNVEGKALRDLGASINLMPLYFYRKLDIDNLRPTSITLQMADRTTTTPWGIVEDVLVRVGEFIFPADFVVLDMHEDKKVPLILGRPFLATGGAMIDVQKGELTLRLHNESITFNIYNALMFHGKEGTEGYQE
ncbi:uncharacterized protein LOC125195346 [Salvia hispanica]|uniref:uncharacterized protein LOC125195346 n=1 Tax=Salvia hispanica TaxID=49212 RepID=UPI0020093FEE|nr:uncharacterized protein LOC125195346 [Salvia hispanica]